MKIQDKFADLIKSGEQTILLEKVSPNNWFVVENGRIKLGTITINGYSIIKNPFTDLVSEEDDFEKWKFKTHKITEITNDGTDNHWIYDNFNELKDYFKDEKEILVLNIEKVE